MPPLGKCEQCGRTVTKHNAAFPVTGWEVLRDGGGANAIRNRERLPNRVRHIECLPKEGVIEGQEAMAI